MLSESHVDHTLYRGTNRNCVSHFFMTHNVLCRKFLIKIVGWNTSHFCCLFWIFSSSNIYLVAPCSSLIMLVLFRAKFTSVGIVIERQHDDPWIMGAIVISKLKFKAINNKASKIKQLGNSQFSVHLKGTVFWGNQSSERGSPAI